MVQRPNASSCILSLTYRLPKATLRNSSVRLTSGLGKMWVHENWRGQELLNARCREMKGIVRNKDPLTGSSRGVTDSDLARSSSRRVRPFEVKKPQMASFPQLVGKGSSNAVASRHRSPLTFFLLVFALSIPFWLIGVVTRRELLPGIR